jgi:choline-sulfatase
VSRIVDGALRGAIAGAFAGLADAAFAFARGPFLAELLLVSAGLFAALGVLVGMGLAVLAMGLWPAWRAIGRAAPMRGPSGRVETAVASVVALVVLLAILFLVGRARQSSDVPGPAIVHALALASIGALVVAGVRPFAALLSRHPRAPAVAIGLVLALGLAATPWFLRAAETVDLRPIAVGTIGAAGFVALAISGQPRGRSVRAALALAALVLALVAPLRLVARTDLRLVAARYAPATGLVARLVARVADFDGDGYSPLSGEGDCAPWDPEVHPFALDVPGNGLDEDCHGGDLDPALVAPRVVPEPAPIPAAQRPHILLVTVDTLRADRLGIYGYERDTTPNLDAFAQDAVVFERAYTSSPVTDRALPTMLGGLYPSMYTEGLDYHEHKLDMRRVLLPERLRDAGYYTATISTTYIVRRDRLHQGLQHVDLKSVHDVRAEPHTDRVLKFLDRVFAKRDRPRPLFLWVHYYDPHGPYEAPREHRLWDDHGKSTEYNRSDRYDGEVRYVDAQLERVLDRLRTIGVLDETLVVFSADHGEEFLEHGGWYHAEELYDESVRVPLIVRLPGGTPGGRRIAETVGLVDLMPTLLELVDIPAPGGIEGRSQAAAIRGTGPADAHPVFLEQWKHKTDIVQKIGVVDGRHKMILDLENQLFELYDVAEDPRERVNRYADDPETASRLRGILLDYWAMVRAAKQLAPEHGAF